MRLIISLALLFSLYVSVMGESIRVRPSEWAQPMLGSTLENFYKVNEKLYRSKQPDGRDFAEIEKFGIKEILNLRSHHYDSDETSSKGLTLHHVPMRAEDIKTEEVIQSLKIIKDSKGPILVHCLHGSDRTGTICAMYRIIFDGWTKEKAIDEMINGNYGFHTFLKNIPEYIRSADIEAIKKALAKP